MSGKVPSRVRITRTQRNTPKYGGNPMSAGLISCGFGRNRVICQKIKSRTAAVAVTPPRPKSPVTDLNFFKTIDLWSAGGSNQATVVSQFGAIGDWDTSAVTNMAEAFKNGRSSTLGGTLDTTTFNEDISGWNTAAVTNMSSMFKGATSFDQPILGSLTDTGTGANAWDTSSVTTMESMFEGATNFTNGGALLGGGAGSGNANYSITAKLGSASGVSCKAMFKNALTTANFDGLFSPIDAPGNKNEIFKNCNDMSSLFEGCTQFNKNISKLVTDNCENMSAMFKDCTIFNQDIHPNNNGGVGTWKTDNVENMSSMFENASAFNKGQIGTNVSVLGLVTSSVTNMSSMFKGAAAFNQNLAWSINGNLTSLASMFQDATSFNGTLNFTSSGNLGCNCTKMFFGASSFTGGGLVDWQANGLANRIADLDSMFKNAVVFNADLSGWRFSGNGSGVPVNVTKRDLDSIFHGASALTSGTLDYSGTGTSTALSWTDLADYIYSIRIRDGDGAIPNFYANGDGYDGTPSSIQYPEITAGTLASFISVIDTNANAVQVDYTLDSNIGGGTITFTRTGGVADSASPHTVTLAGAELNQGSFSGLLTNAPTLVVDAIYNLTFTITGGASRTFTDEIPFGQFDKVGDDYWLAQYGADTQAHYSSALTQSLIDDMAAAYTAGKTVQMKFVDGTPITENSSYPAPDISVYQALTYTDLTVVAIGTTGSNTTIRFNTNPFSSYQNLKAATLIVKIT